jgi:hypothetical protein
MIHRGAQTDFLQVRPIYGSPHQKIVQAGPADGSPQEIARVSFRALLQILAVRITCMESTQSL